MNHYTLYDPATGEQYTTKPSLEAATKLGIQRLTLRGILTFVYHIDPDFTELRALDGSVYYRAQVYQKPARVAETPAYAFVGRPSADGWLHSPKRCELHVSLTLPMCQPTAVNQFFLVYMAASGSPLTAVLVPDVINEATQLSSQCTPGNGRNKRRVTVDTNALARQMALAHVLAEPPSGAVAVFLVRSGKVNSNPLHIDVIGKRVTAGLAPVQYKSKVHSHAMHQPTIFNRSTGVAPMTAEEARRKYEDGVAEGRY